MFEIGWSELLVIAVVALIAIGPKELPGVLRTAGQWIGKIRRMAADFQGQFQEALREAEMEDLKKQVDDLKSAADDLSAHYDPLQHVRTEFDDVNKAIEENNRAIAEFAAPPASGNPENLPVPAPEHAPVPVEATHPPAEPAVAGEPQQTTADAGQEVEHPAAKAAAGGSS
jgi:sec-independent protein translocase protein TatB